MNFNEFMCFHYVIYSHLPSSCLCSAEPSFFLFVYLLFVPGFLFPAPSEIQKYNKAWEIQPWAAFEEAVNSY